MMDTMVSPALASIARLRRICSALEAGHAPDADDAAWLATRLRNYFADAPRGLTVDMALDLAPMPGAAAWWTDEAIEARDAALRDLAARFYPECRVASQAFQIARLSLRYAASAWRFDRESDATPERYRGTETECLWRAFKSGVAMPLAKRQIQTILAMAKRADAA